jgi:hypothetical protein
MSKIKEIPTPNIKSLESLLKSLVEAGVPENAIEVDRTCSNTLPLVDYYRQTQTNALTVRIRKDVTGAYEDAGFKFVNGTFQAVVSTHDREQDFGAVRLQKTTVRYTVNEAKREAKRNGYILTEQVVGTTLKLICKKLS